MLRIRLSRVGKKKQPAYRIVVADSRAPRAGTFLKIIGHYNPLTDPATLTVKEEEAIHWLQKGAQPSDTAAKLLTRIGVMERAGKAPVRFVGKEVPPAEKQPKKDADAPAAAPAPVTATPEASAPVSEVEAAPEPEVEAPPEPEVEAAPEPEVEPSADDAEATATEAESAEPAAGEATTEPEPEATE